MASYELTAFRRENPEAGLRLLHGQGEALEGLTAFVNKRSPDFA